MAAEWNFVAPMLCHKLKDKVSISKGEWVAEEKFDGHRLVLYKGGSEVVAWSRDLIRRDLPKQVIQDALLLPDGTYDGELLAPGKRSYGVTDKSHSSLLVYNVFDITKMHGIELHKLTWLERRNILIETAMRSGIGKGIATCEVWEIESREHLTAICQRIWDKDGEGIIAKRKASPYQIGSRSRDWLKLKDKKTALLECVGYLHGLEGPYARVLLRDEEGNTTRAKTRNSKERERLAATPGFFVGKKLWIEFQERTPDGNYRGPVIWDRWEDE